MPWRLALVALAFLAGTQGVARARCGDDPGDAQAVADARTQVDSDCDCAGAASHRDYVRCAIGVARTRADAGQLRSQCRSAVKRCAAKSTCGTPGAVSCCIERNGSFRCLIRRDAGSCAGRGGTTGADGSCCDTCGGGVPTSTTTPPPTTTTTVYIPPCGFLPGPECGGTCPTGERCGSEWSAASPDVRECHCFPDDVTPCGDSLTCGGVCTQGRTCQAAAIYDGPTLLLAECFCLDPTSTCGPGSCQSPGLCPAGSGCEMNIATQQCGCRTP